MKRERSEKMVKVALGLLLHFQGLEFKVVGMQDDLVGAGIDLCARGGAEDLELVGGWWEGDVTVDEGGVLGIDHRQPCGDGLSGSVLVMET